MAGMRATLNGGPADGQVLELDQLVETIERSEPRPGPGRPDPAPYRLRRTAWGEPLMSSTGLLYAYDWHTADDWRRNVPLSANQPPNSRGDRGSRT